MLRLTRIVLFLGAALLILAPAAHARATSEQTLRFRVPVPTAPDFSILTFELRIGAEGRKHRKQPVTLDLVNHKEPGVFALARLRPEPGHPGRFLGVVEVFHRAGASAAALPSGLTALSRAAPLARGHAATGPYDEFVVRLINGHVIKEVIKDNIEEIAERHGLGSDEFCDPEDEEEYLLGNAVIGTAYIQAGSLLNLPTHTSANQLARDAVEELCDDIEDEEEGGPEDEGQYPGIGILNAYLGIKASTPMTPSSTYRLEFKGAWAFAAGSTNEVQLTGAFTGTYTGSGSPPSTSTSPLSAIRVVLPALGSTPRAVTNYICPSQLPMAAIITTNNANDTLQCSGGTLPLNQTFSLNVQTSPPPSSGMGGTLFALQGSAYLAPFTFGGP